MEADSASMRDDRTLVPGQTWRLLGHINVSSRHNLFTLFRSRRCPELAKADYLRATTFRQLLAEELTLGNHDRDLGF